MTTLVVLQPSYLPWLGYFDQMSKADVFVWYDDVQFDKHGWRNRNRIKSPKGPLWLTVPVLHKGRALQPSAPLRSTIAYRGTGNICDPSNSSMPARLSLAPCCRGSAKSCSGPGSVW